MKRFIASVIASLTIILGLVGSAHATAIYCGTSAFEVQYRKIYQYPTGSFWVNQIHNYPEYYAANNAYYQSNYGC